MTFDLRKALASALAHPRRPATLATTRSSERTAPSRDDALDAIVALLDEGLATALVVDGPSGLAKAAWVPIDRVLLARHRLAVLAGDAEGQGL